MWNCLKLSTIEMVVYGFACKTIQSIYVHSIFILCHSFIAELIPLYVRQVGLCHTQCHTAYLCTSKLCFELFCCIYGLSIVVIILLFTIPFAALCSSAVFQLRLSFFATLVVLFSHFIRCTTQTGDNLIGLCIFPFPFCAHISPFFCLFESTFQLLQRRSTIQLFAPM